MTRCTLATKVFESSNARNSKFSVIAIFEVRYVERREVIADENARRPGGTPSIDEWTWLALGRKMVAAMIIDFNFVYRYS